MTALSIKDVGLRLGAVDILENISLTVPPARVVAILGLSGSGTTAILRAVAGLERPHNGTIRIGERVVFDAASKVDVAAQKRGAGLMFDALAGSSGWTVFDNVALGARFRGGNWAVIRRRIADALSKAGIVELAQRPMAQLTRWQQRRVALARALASEPAVLLLDDPFAGFDQAERAEARLWLKQLIAQTGVTTLMATSERHDALALAERIVLINGGVIEQEGTPA